MTKKKKRPSANKPRLPGGQPPSAKLLRTLEEAQTLIRRGQLDDAIDLLEAADRRHPHRPEVLAELVNAYHDAKDVTGYLSACERLNPLSAEIREIRAAIASGDSL